MRLMALLSCAMPEVGYSKPVVLEPYTRHFGQYTESEATKCVVCTSLISNDDCNKNGVSRICKPNEVCYTQVTHYRRRFLIKKRCTPRRYCNDHCRGQLCRKCCMFDECNRDMSVRIRQPRSQVFSSTGTSDTGQRRQTCDPISSRGVQSRCIRLKSAVDTGTTCLFWCARQDYILQGASRLTCVNGRNGAQWSGNAPTCVAKTSLIAINARDCPPIDYDRAVLAMDCSDGVNYRSVCTFRCKAGSYLVHETTYRPIASRRTVCWRGKREPAVWTKPVPKCLTKKCPVFVREGISTVSCTNWIRSGSVCVFECLPGYYRVGPRILECMDRDGLGIGWNTTTPTCEPRKCAKLNFASAIIKTRCNDSLSFRSQCGFSCAPGYYLTRSDDAEPLPQNNAISRCVVSRKDRMLWRPRAPTCRKKKCRDILFIDDGYVQCTDGSNYLSRCSFFCNDAYLLSGTDVLICDDGDSDGDNTKHGIWDGTVPWCRPKICSPPLYNSDTIGLSCSDGFSYGSKCTFSCQVGFYMTKIDGETFLPGGQSTIECIINEKRLVWSGKAPMCHLKTCGEIDIPEHGFISCTDENYHGSRCAFHCSPGYLLRGSESTTCEESDLTAPDSVWSHDAPFCEAKACPEIHYGSDTADMSCTAGQLYRSLCTFHCKQGYYMLSPIRDEVIGNAARLCFLNDSEELEWSDSSPRCLTKNCPPLSNPVNGEVHCPNDFVFGSVCKFTCDGGFETDGSDELTCSDDGRNSKVGVWDSQPPTCIRRSCDEFDVDLSSTVYICDNELKYQSTCVFHCVIGHYMTKQSKIVESAEAVCRMRRDRMVWSADPPTCAVKTCPELSNPEGGVLICNNGFAFGSTCRTVCSAAFYLSGQRLVGCEDNGINDPRGVWSHPIATCERRSCSSRADTVPSTMVESCDAGYLYQSRCDYRCRHGYYMEIDGEVAGRNVFEIVCAVDGKNMEWSSALPACKIKFCSSAGRIPENGESSCAQNGTFGSACVFSCKPGFNLVGENRATCKSSDGNNPAGVWDVNPPFCERRSCDDIAHDATTLTMTCDDGNRLDSVCGFTCRTGYNTIDAGSGRFAARANRTCSVDYEGNMYWKYSQPLCVKKSCPAHAALEYGTVSCTDGPAFGSVCSFDCEPGFRLVGDAEVTCMDLDPYNQFGEWSGSIPSCRRKSCPELAHNRSTSLVTCGSSRLFESVCEFSCKPGYYTTSSVHDARTTCTVRSGEMHWTNSPPECLIKTCADPRVSTGGRVECDRGNLFGSSCVFSCVRYRELRGNGTLRCEADGRNIPTGIWDSQFPTCELRSCDFIDVDRASTDFNCNNKFRYNSECQFTCAPGHYMTKQSRVVDRASTSCGIRGDVMEWSEDPPLCERKSCPEIDVPVGGSLKCTDGSKYKSACKLVCAPAFYLDGRSAVQCEDDGGKGPSGVWSDGIGNCKRRSCPSRRDNVPPTMSETCDNSYLFESECTYRCGPGHYMTVVGELASRNEMRIACGIDDETMTWSSELPACRMKICDSEGRAPRYGGTSCASAETFGSACTFACDPGFVLVGDAETKCGDSADNGPDGVWSTDPPVCDRRRCADVNYDATSLMMSCGDGRRFESVCSFSCATGQYTVDPSSGLYWERANTTCAVGAKETMYWTRAPPQCAKKSCPVRPEFEHGTVSCTERLEFGTVCSYVCMPGFRLLGVSQNECVDTDRYSQNGAWDTPMPACERRQCPDLEYDRDNTLVACTLSNAFESVCEFTCVTGYYLASGVDGAVTGYADTECTVRSGAMYWSKPSPSCLIKTCPNPRKPDEGSVECNLGNLYESECTFSCAIHRELRGDGKLRCESDGANTPDGRWSSDYPTCELRSCPDWDIDPRAIIGECANAYKYGSTCRFSCNTGHYFPPQNRTDGEQSTGAECDIEGSVMTWRGEIPVCEIKTCDALKSPENGRFECSHGYDWDTNCEFSCRRGFLLIGKSSLRCTDDGRDRPHGTWDGVEPTCEERSCPELPYDQTVQIARCNFGVRYGSACEFSCKIGYYLTASDGVDLIDSASAVCDVDPNNFREVAWRHDAPRCMVKTCPKPVPPVGGLVTCANGHTFGQRCRYSCDPGFDMIGLPLTTCRDVDRRNTRFGSWGKDPPTCEPKSCAKLVHDGTTDFECTDEWKYRSVCTFSCNKGHFLNGADGRTIVESGTVSTKCDLGFRDAMAWTQAVPSCLSKYCIAIRPKRNMTVECSDGFKYQSRCTFACDPPLRLVGPPVMNCMDDETSLFSGKWDGRFWRLRCQR